METKRICSICGKTLVPSAPEGLCPECLLKAGMGTGVEIGPDTETGAPRTRFVPPKLVDLAPLFPQLEILGLIGQGGMGAVYRARQKQLDRMVALKILPPDVGRSPSFAERFAREARALAKLNHPGIVTLYEFGRAELPLGQDAQQHAATDPLYFFLMEFVDGVNLGQLLHAGKLAPKEAPAIVPQICDALQYAHDRGIVHRDIKPENILLGRDGQVKVADFGIAKLAERGRPSRSGKGSTEDSEKAGASHAGGSAAAETAALSSITGLGKIMGTLQYMAPEQKEHPLEVDHRADIYSLGVVLYQMLTGELPAGKFEPPSRKVQVDVRIDEIVLRALEKNPELRYQQASEVKTMVETIAGTLGSSGSRREEAQSAKLESQRPHSKAGTWPVQRLAAEWILKASAFGWGVLLFCAYGLPKFVDAWAQSDAELSPLMRFFVAVGTYKKAGWLLIPLLLLTTIGSLTWWIWTAVKTRAGNGARRESKSPLGDSPPSAAPDRARATSAVPKTPWQIWFVVVVLGLEGLGNLASIPR